MLSNDSDNIRAAIRRSSGMQAERKTIDAITSTGSKTVKKSCRIVTERSQGKNDFNPNVASTSNALAQAGAGITGTKPFK